MTYECGQALDFTGAGNSKILRPHPGKPSAVNKMQGVRVGCNPPWALPAPLTPVAEILTSRHTLLFSHI